MGTGGVVDMYGMHRWIVEFALVISALGVVYEILVQISGWRLWVIMAKWHMGIAAAAMFLSVLTGLVDLKFAWATPEGRQLMASHKVLGYVLFFLVLFLANYRLLLYKLFPAKLYNVYFGLCGLYLGLLFGIGQIGKLSIYQYGVGVNAAMITHEENMEYIKALYNLHQLPAPSAEDSLRAEPLKPITLDTLSGTEHKVGEKPSETDPDDGHRNDSHGTNGHH